MPSALNLGAKVNLSQLSSFDFFQTVIAKPNFSAMQCSEKPSPHVLCSSWLSHHSSRVVGIVFPERWFAFSWISGANHGLSRSLCFLACCTVPRRSSAAATLASSGVSVLLSLAVALAAAHALYKQSPAPCRSCNNPFLGMCCDP